MKCVAVLGGGLMGSGIATALVQAGYEVLLKEVNQQFLEVGWVGRMELRALAPPCWLAVRCCWRSWLDRTPRCFPVCAAVPRMGCLSRVRATQQCRAPFEGPFDKSFTSVITPSNLC